ncbi:interferon-induced transmembrane protein 5-like [Podargus strigoides]
MERSEVCVPLEPYGRGATAAGPDGQPRDFVLWSLLNVLLGQSLTYLGCLCFPALLYSIKARDCKVLGDLEGARRHGKRAKVWNIVCSALMAFAVVMTISSIIIIILSVNTT